MIRKALVVSLLFATPALAQHQMPPGRYGAETASPAPAAPPAEQPTAQLRAAQALLNRADQTLQNEVAAEYALNDRIAEMGTAANAQSKALADMTEQKAKLAAEVADLTKKLAEAQKEIPVKSSSGTPERVN